MPAAGLWPLEILIKLAWISIPHPVKSSMPAPGRLHFLRAITFLWSLVLELAGFISSYHPAHSLTQKWNPALNHLQPPQIWQRPLLTLWEKRRVDLPCRSANKLKFNIKESMSFCNFPATWVYLFFSSKLLSLSLYLPSVPLLLPMPSRRSFFRQSSLVSLRFSCFLPPQIEPSSPKSIKGWTLSLLLGIQWQDKRWGNRGGWMEKRRQKENDFEVENIVKEERETS